MKARSILDVALRVGAFALLASMTAAAWHDVSQAWDVWYYHLPFAARIAGLTDARAYVFSAANQARFEGFPLLAEALQGAAWRLSGRPECANLVALASLPAMAWWLRRRHGVPMHLTLLALLAVPLVQIHATASYVDLPANTCATMLLLCAFEALLEKRPPSPGELAVAGLLAAATVNMKFQLVPVAVAASLVLVVRSLRRDAGLRKRLVILAVAAPLVFATPIKNSLVHENPVWPIELRVLGLELPHAEQAYGSSPAYLRHAPRSLRFAYSVLEIGLRPITSGRRWSIDQYAPPDHPAYRMGGFFGAYVIVNLLALALAVVKRQGRVAGVAALFLLGVTVLTSVVPQSHELRYYLYWMMLLVALNLVLWARDAPLATGLVSAAALAVVVAATRAIYIYPTGDAFDDLLAAKVDHALLETAAPGSRLCVARGRWTFLHAPLFHPDKRYSVQEAEAPEDCPHGSSNGSAARR